MKQLLTFERNGAVCEVRVFCFPQTEQGGGEERVVDEVLHVVVLTLLFVFSAHLIGHILPAEDTFINTSI